ncbi:UNVERIFIED_CONTAM: hypothetical protein HDU68_009876 [Siphonaria sp. JEL0065]|nr:hypothetical protein HDU68_009876 [Siphonaria sp. JEL0065]
MKKWSDWVKVRRLEHERAEYEKNPALYEMKRSSRYYSTSDAGSSVGLNTVQRGSTYFNGPPVIPTGLIMPPIFNDNRASYYGQGGVLPPPPPPGFVMPKGALPGPPPPGLMPGALQGSMPGPPPPGLVMPFTLPASINGGNSQSPSTYNSNASLLGNTANQASLGLHQRLPGSSSSEDSDSL